MTGLAGNSREYCGGFVVAQVVTANPNDCLRQVCARDVAASCEYFETRFVQAYRNASTHTTAGSSHECYAHRRSSSKHALVSYRHGGIAIVQSCFFPASRICGI